MDHLSSMKEILKYNLCFVRRSANKATHCLAQVASSRYDLGDYTFRVCLRKLI